MLKPVFSFFLLKYLIILKQRKTISVHTPYAKYMLAHFLKKVKCFFVFACMHVGA